ncbi:type II secretion system protein [Phycisphaeraceae bacterium D3-23]
MAKDKTVTRRRRAGVTMIEAVGSMVIVSGAMVAALNAVSGARASQVMVDDRARARLLAETMMGEVLAQDYAEPGSTTIGPDSGEGGSDIRNQYDDVDDYHGWLNTVRTPDGTAVPGFEAYKLSFTVVWVNSANPGTPVASDQGVKRITVTVTRDTRVVAELHGWKASP